MAVSERVIDQSFLRQIIKYAYAVGAQVDAINRELHGGQPGQFRNVFPDSPHTIITPSNLRLDLTYDPTGFGLPKLAPVSVCVGIASIQNPFRGSIRISRISAVEIRPHEVRFEADEVDHVNRAEELGMGGRVLCQPGVLVVTPDSFAVKIQPQITTNGQFRLPL